MAKTKRTPELRFKEFMDEWEEKEFSKIVSRIGLFSDDSSLPRVEYDDIASGTGMLNKDISKKESIKKGIRFEKGDILFGKLRPYLNNWLLSDFDGLAVGDFWVLRANNYDEKFIFSLIQNRKYQYVSNLSTGTKMPRSDWSVVSTTDFPIPQSRIEQSRIGTFFQNLDSLIAQRRRKLDKLVAVKKSMLEKMFPKEGAEVPELRFKGFAGKWERRKLGELVTIKSGWSPSTFCSGNELFIKVDDLNYSLYEQKSSQAKVGENPKLAMIKKGSVIFPKRGAAIMTNKVRILAADGYMDTNMMALEPDGLIGSFLYLYIYLTGLYKIADTSTIPQINNKHIEPYGILLPNNDEQIKIATFFQHLNSLIALQRRELDTLKNLKKAFLEKMFV